MKKKIVAIILLIGAIIAIVLGVLFWLKTKELKTHLESTLNAHFTKLLGDHKAIFLEKFACSGLLDIDCHSPSVSIKIEDEMSIVLKNVGFELKPSSQNSIKALLYIDEIAPVLKNISQENAFMTDLEMRFMPSKLTCDVGLELQGEQEAHESLACKLSAGNADYEITNNAIRNHPRLKGKNIAQALESFYSDLAFLDEIYAKDGQKYALKSSSLIAHSKGFSEDLRKFYDRTAEERKQLEMSDNFFSEFVETLKLAFVSVFSSIYDDMELVSSAANALEDFMTGDKKTFGLSITPKEAGRFIDLDELRDLSTFGLHYNIRAISE